MKEQFIIFLKQYLQDYEPHWVTHPQSCWNRARRQLIELETGVIISDARSYDKDTDSWVL